MKTTRIVALGALLALSGCAERGEQLDVASGVVMPAEYERATSADASGEKISSLWWEDFNSSELNRLVVLALDKNPDILSAFERMIQAELSLKSVSASLFPSLSVTGSTSERGSAPHGSSDFSSTQATSASLSLSYEIDLFGRVRASRDAAKAVFLASKYDAETVRLSLISGIAESYFRLLATRLRVAIAKENLTIATRLSEIVNARYKEGAVSGLDVNAQRSSVLSQRANLFTLENEEKVLKNALAILVGEVPQDFMLGNERFDDLRFPSISAGLPSDLLKHRPDIAANLAKLSGGEFSVDSAYYALFPSFNISGSGTLLTNSLLSLTNPAQTLSLALNSTWNLFDSGRLKNALEMEKSKLRTLFENYKKSILTALKEVEDALENERYNKERVELQHEILLQTQRSLEIAFVRYSEGLIDVSALLEYQHAHFSAQDQGAQQRLAHLLSILSLHKAVGGGFEVGK